MLSMKQQFVSWRMHTYFPCAAGPSPPPPPPRLAIWPVLMRNVFDGRLLGSKGENMTVKQCQDQCMAEPLCVAISYAPTAGVCWMRSTVTGWKPNNFYDSYVISQASLPSQAVCPAYYIPSSPPPPPPSKSPLLCSWSMMFFSWCNWLKARTCLAVVTGVFHYE